MQVERRDGKSSVSVGDLPRVEVECEIEALRGLHDPQYNTRRFLGISMDFL